MNMAELAHLFDLLIEARNSKDEEALQEAIDLVASALACKACGEAPRQGNPLATGTYEYCVECAAQQ